MVQHSLYNTYANHVTGDELGKDCLSASPSCKLTQAWPKVIIRHYLLPCHLSLSALAFSLARYHILVIVTPEAEQTWQSFTPSFH
jgi:hypothetical protein